MAYPMVGIGVGALLAFLAAWLAAAVLDRIGFPRPETETRAGCVDGLRGILALSVMIHHFIVWMQVARLGGGWVGPTVNLFANLGAGSVALFFMVTGGLFYPRVLKGFRLDAMAALFVNRLFRLTPPIAVSVLVVAAIVVAFHDPVVTFRSAVRAPLTWMFAFGEPDILGHEDTGRMNAYVLWSLRFEWQYYVIVVPLTAAVYGWARDRVPTWVWPVVLIVGSAVARLFLSTRMLTFLPLFAIGMLAAEAGRVPALRAFLSDRRFTVVALVLLAVGTTWDETPYGFVPMTALGLFFVSIWCGNSLFGLLDRRAFVVLGECSYGIYLFHGILLYGLFVFGDRAVAAVDLDVLPLAMPFVALVLVPLTALIHVAVERPTTRLGRRLADRARQRVGLWWAGRTAAADPAS